MSELKSVNEYYRRLAAYGRPNRAADSVWWVLRRTGLEGVSNITIVNTSVVFIGLGEREPSKAEGSARLSPVYVRWEARLPLLRRDHRVNIVGDSGGICSASYTFVETNAFSDCGDSGAPIYFPYETEWGEERIAIVAMVQWEGVHAVTVGCAAYEMVEHHSIEFGVGSTC